MKFAFFQGCNIPARLNQYADATRAVCRKLDIELVEPAGFNCCGYPARNIDQRAFILSAAKNLALAESTGMDMMVMCKCCYGSLKMAEYMLGRDHDLNKKINNDLAKERLHYNGCAEIKHLLMVLHRDVGLKNIKSYVSKTFSGLQIAVSYGCHALRPSRVTAFDDPVAPKLFDELVEITGAYSVDWTRKLDCCGAAMTGVDERLAVDMALKKLTSAADAGAHFICTACPYSHLQFDWVRNKLTPDLQESQTPAPILYPQLLGLSMGIDTEALGLSRNGFEPVNLQPLLMSE